MDIHSAHALRMAEMPNKARRALRIAVFTETKRVAAEGLYQAASGRTVHIPVSQIDASVQAFGFNDFPVPSIQYPECAFRVLDGDCIESAI